MSGRLEGKRAIVTGSGNGIGRAIAEQFAIEGAQVAVLDINSAAVLEVVTGIGDHATGYTVDVGDPTQLQQVIGRVIEEFGGLDILVNNAGVFDQNAPCEEVTLEAWNRIMEINVRSVVFGMQRALAEMLPQGHGAIVNMTSVNAFRGLGGGVAYSASKGAIVSLTRQTACEVGNRGIRVNAIAPGGVATNVFANTEAILGDVNPVGPIGQQWKDNMRNMSSPLGGMTEPLQVARAAVFLASDDASYITGEILFVDGGAMASF